MKYDVTIIGAGIIGSLMADKLAKYDLKVCVLEKNNDSGLEQSMSSSAIVHSGIDPKEGSLKAKLNVLGNKLMPEICNDLNVEYHQVGGYMCAKNEKDLEVLNKYYNQGLERDIDCSIIEYNELVKREPNISKDIIKALNMPTTGVIYPMELTVAAIERSIINGVDVFYNQEVIDINYTDYFEINTKNKTFKSDYIINCAGLYSDFIARLVDNDFDINIKPKRGEYYVTDNTNPVVDSVIYPTPDENGKGVLAVVTTHKNVLLGPNGVMQDDKDDDSTHVSDLMFVKNNITKILESFPTDIIKTYAGIRATGNNGDFYLDLSKNKKMFNCVCIDSPGLASAPAIVEYILDKMDFNLKNKQNYTSNRERYLDLKKLDLDVQNQYIKSNKDYGKIICRCEQITKGEIIDSIHKINGATDLTGIKFRIRPMLGMCQGGFCEAEVLKILAKELNVSKSQITRRGPDTVIVKKEV